MENYLVLFTDHKENKQLFGFNGRFDNQSVAKKHTLITLIG